MSGFCVEKTQIGLHNLKFVIKLCKDSSNFVNLLPFAVEAGINYTQFLPVLDGTEEGIRLSIPNDEGSDLQITVEKDFKCLVPRGEDDLHAFEHPLEGKITC